MNIIPPVAFTWDGEAMVPKHPRLADRHYVVGQTYTLEERLERSQRSHAHYFACIHEAWQNLPHDLAEQFVSSEHLRKFALIKARFCDERSITCASRAEALRVAAFIKPLDDYAVVTVSQAVVSVYTAKSQSVRAMGKADFQRSKDAVLDYIASLIGTSAADLSKNASEAA